MHFSVQPKDRIFVNDYGFLSFANNIDKKLGININKILSGKYSQKSQLRKSRKLCNRIIQKQLQIT